MAENQKTNSNNECSNRDDGNQEQLKELENLVIHASECHNSQCNVVGCQKVKYHLSQASFSVMRETGTPRMCETLWIMFFLHVNACTSSNCPIPSCMEWRENLRNAKKSESDQSTNINEDVGLARDASADPNASARRRQMVQQVEPKSSTAEGSLATGSGSGLASSASVLKSTASPLKIKKQVDLVSSKSQVLAKLMEKPIGSCSCSGSDSGAIVVRNARQLRMKQQVMEGCRKNKNPIQNKKQYEYTDKDKSIMLGITTVIMHELFRNAKK